MAQPTTVAFGKFYILVGDEESPETFEAPCGLTSKGFNQTASSQDTVVPDCDDPDGCAVVERAIDAKSSEISGDGVLALEDLNHIWQPWYDSCIARNVRIGLNAIPDIAIGGYWEGPFLLTSLNLSAERGQKARAAITLVNAAAWEWVPFATSPGL